MGTLITFIVVLCLLPVMWKVLVILLAWTTGTLLLFCSVVIALTMTAIILYQIRKGRL